MVDRLLVESRTKDSLIIWLRGGDTVQSGWINKTNMESFKEDR